MLVRSCFFADFACVAILLFSGPKLEVLLFFSALYAGRAVSTAFSRVIRRFFVAVSVLFPAEHPCAHHDNVQIRLHPFPQSAAELGFERSVKTECALLTHFLTFEIWSVFWLTSLTSQNSPSEPKCRKLQYFWVFGMCQNAGRQVSQLPCFYYGSKDWARSGVALIRTLLTSLL